MLSKLDILNAMLGSIGQLPVNDPDEDNELVTRANQIINQQLTSTQAPGWWYNTERAVLKYDATSGRVRVSADIISVRAPGRELVLRGTAIYDTEAGDWCRDPELQVQLVRQLALEDLPLQAQELVRAACVVQFCTDMDADQQKILLAAEAMKTAKRELGTQHIRSVRANLLQTPWLQVNHNFIGRLRR